MNNALRHASGDYVNFMNADDCFISAHTLSDAARVIGEAFKDGEEKPGVFYGDSVAEEFGQTYAYDDKDRVTSSLDIQKNETKFE